MYFIDFFIPQETVWNVMMKVKNNKIHNQVIQVIHPKSLGIVVEEAEREQMIPGLNLHSLNHAINFFLYFS